MAYEVRRAVRSDVAEVRQVAITTWQHAYQGLIPHEVQQRFLHENYSDHAVLQRMEHAILYVAEKEQRLIGFAHFVPFKRSKEQAELAALYVLPEAQAQGVGTRLLEAGIRDIAEAMRFVLSVEKDNIAAQRFYKAKGFAPTNESSFQLYGHVFHLLHMVWERREKVKL